MFLITQSIYIYPNKDNVFLPKISSLVCSIYTNQESRLPVMKSFSNELSKNNFKKRNQLFFETGFLYIRTMIRNVSTLVLIVDKVRSGKVNVL